MSPNSQQGLLIRRAKSDDYEMLIGLWLRSVRATHGFLAEMNIESLLPDVRAGLRSDQLELWVCCLNDDGVVGFMGLAGQSLEALFLDPRHLRAGIGRRMVEHAVALKGDLTVEVNEQNPAAVRFYEACGFELEGRSALDSAGRPFPILHMRLVTPVETISHWRRLGSVEPTALVSSRETLHHAAQLLALAGASYLEHRADDSDTSMSWLEDLGAFATELIPAAAPFRFALRVRELGLVVIDDASGNESALFSLQHETRSDALAWMRREASRRGLDGNRLRSQLHFAIAPHPTDQGHPFEQPTDGTLDELAAWYANANFVLESTRCGMAGAGPVRCWPHHFDIATLVRLPRPGALQTIGIGLSPGDESYPEPYYYLSPYPMPEKRPLPLSIGRWHTEGWWGAALVGSEIVKQKTPDEQAGLVIRFIENAVERLLETNARDA